jgi:hypothetical protein
MPPMRHQGIGGIGLARRAARGGYRSAAFGVRDVYTAQWR